MKPYNMDFLRLISFYSWCLIWQCLCKIIYPLVIIVDFWLNPTVYKEHTLYDFNLFKIVDKNLWPNFS